MSAHRIEIDDLIALRRDAGRVELRSERRVHADRVGARLSGVRGRGMEFEEHRAYQPGDEARTIDWRVTARTGKPHVRLYREDRERPVLLAVDQRPAMWFGTRRCYKAVLAARAAALCAWAAVGKGDRVGGVAFGLAGHREVRPAGGVRGALALLRALEAPAPAPATPEGSLADALQRLLRLARGGTLVGLFSDFRGLGQREADLLVRLARRAELIVGFVRDPLEVDLPPPAPALYPVAGADANPFLLDAGDRDARARWHDAFRARQRAVQELARGNGAHWVELDTAAPLPGALTRIFGRKRRGP